MTPPPFHLSRERKTNLSVVDTNDASDHFWDDNHISQMCLDNSWLFVGGSLLLGLAELLDQTHGTALESTLEATTSTGMDELGGGRLGKNYFKILFFRRHTSTN